MHHLLSIVPKWKFDQKELRICRLYTTKTKKLRFSNPGNWKIFYCVIFTHLHLTTSCVQVFFPPIENLDGVFALGYVWIWVECDCEETQRPPLRKWGYDYDWCRWEIQMVTGLSQMWKNPHSWVPFLIKLPAGDTKGRWGSGGDKALGGGLPSLRSGRKYKELIINSILFSTWNQIERWQYCLWGQGLGWLPKSDSEETNKKSDFSSNDNNQWSSMWPQALVIMAEPDEEKLRQNLLYCQHLLVCQFLGQYHSQRWG